ncbi:MAG: PrsW family intramembrane metalloprotease [Chloroflexi bacterium]|nr:PrsW family intramembrane metalloprotease [Chloroflexota bacterium]
MLVFGVGWLGVVASFVLAWAYAALLYWADRHEKEPKGLLLGMFLWGALVATLGSALFSSAIDAGLSGLWPTDAATRAWVDTTVIAPLVEESFKAAALVLLFWFAAHEVDSLFDGVIYAALVGLGFEAVENALYFVATLVEGGVGQSLLVGALRLGLFGFTHAFYTSLTGLGLAVWRLYSRRWWAWLAPLAGWAAAVLAHALHNASMNLGAPACVVGIGSDWLGLAAVAGILLWALRREARWLREHLRAEVEAGRITPAQYRTALSLARRARALRQARKKGARYAQATREFYRLLTDLAFVLAHIGRGHRDAHFRQRAQELRAAIARLAPHADAA